MALMDIKSDLSWYGKTPKGPYKTPTSKSDSRFTIGGPRKLPMVITGGYNPDGVSNLAPISLYAGNGFAIGGEPEQGTSSRGAQLGSGTKFPIGPTGNIHEFDKERLGFSYTNKYGNIYGTRFGNSGLADTYTANSPIDDMYDKFNLRDDATPNSYIKHPLDLRGIQKAGSSDPERYGLSLTPGVGGGFDIPRGGLLTAATRTAIDVKRIAKFMASPAGLGFAAKQLGYQLMNPKPSTRLWNPLSLGSIAPTVHINRHIGGDGLLGGLVDSLVGDVLPSQNEMLWKENRTKTVGGQWGTLSATIGGPGSLLGIGGTLFKKQDGTTMEDQFASGDVGLQSKITYNSSRFNYNNPYLSGFTLQGVDDDNNRRSAHFQNPWNPNGENYNVSLKTAYENNFNQQTDLRQSTRLSDQQSANPFISNQVDLAKFHRYGTKDRNTNEPTLYVENEQQVGTDGITSEQQELTDENVTSKKGQVDYNQTLPQHVDTNKLSRYESEKTYEPISGEPDDGIDSNIDKATAKGGGNAKAGETPKGQEVDYTEYKTNSYDDIKSKASSRNPFDTTINDFRDNSNYQTEAKSTKLEKKLEQGFEGGTGRDGDTQRGRGSNSSKAGGAEQGQKTREWETMSYDDIASAGENRKIPSTNDFNFKQKGDFGKTKGVVSDSDVEQKSKGEGWISDDPKGDRQGGGYAQEPNDGKSTSLGSYKRTAYGSIPESKIATKVTSHNDFRDQGQSQKNKIGWNEPKVDDLAEEIDKGLVKFEIGGIKFKAYLGSISENHAGQWDGAQDQGRADQRYLYSSYERTISTDFIVPIFKEADRATIWENIQKLAQKTMPEYGSSGFHGQTVKVTIGDMFKDMEMIITDLSYDWDNETPWEIKEGQQAPFYTAVTISFTVLGDKPTKDTKLYQNF
jgi:hypothetical protein